MRTFWGTLKQEHISQFPGDLWIPITFAAKLQFGGFAEAGHEHELRTKKSPTVRVQVPLEKGGRRFFLQHFVRAADWCQIIHVIFPRAAVLWGITPLLG